MSEFSGGTMKAFAIYNTIENTFLRQHRNVGYYWNGIPTLYETLNQAKRAWSGVKGSNTRWPMDAIDLDNAKIVEIGFVMGTKDLR